MTVWLPPCAPGSFSFRFPMALRGTTGHAQIGKPTTTFSTIADKFLRQCSFTALPPSTDPLEPKISEKHRLSGKTNVVPKPSPPLKRTIWNQCRPSAAAKHSALVAIGKAGIVPSGSLKKLPHDCQNCV
jgi:hypothetical protein